MPLTIGGSVSLARNWFFSQASRFRLFTGPAVVGSSGNEITTAGYRPGAFGTNPWSVNESTGAITNGNVVTMGTITAQSANITHWGITDSTGTLIYRGVFTDAPGVLAINTVLELQPGNINIRFPSA